MHACQQKLLPSCRQVVPGPEVWNISHIQVLAVGLGASRVQITLFQVRDVVESSVLILPDEQVCVLSPCFTMKGVRFLWTLNCRKWHSLYHLHLAPPCLALVCFERHWATSSWPSPDPSLSQSEGCPLIPLTLLLRIADNQVIRRCPSGRVGDAQYFSALFEELMYTHIVGESFLF